MGLTKVTYAMINGASFNVYDFGAVGDGVADDTAAFQAALDAIKTSDTTCSLWVPAGTYIISDTLTYNQTSLIKSVSIIGEDETKTILRFTGTGGCLSFNLGAITEQKVNHLTIKNLSLYAFNANAGSAIRIIRDERDYTVAPTVLLEDIYVYNNLSDGDYWTYGFHTTDCGDVWINRCYLMFYNTSTTTAGIFFDNSLDIPTFGAYISGTSINGGTNCIKCTGWLESLYLTDTALAGAYDCLYLDATGTTSGDPHLTVKGCHFNSQHNSIYTNYWRGIFITGTDVYSGVGSGDVAGDNLHVLNASSVMITGSKFEIGATGLARTFISFENVTDYSITGNTMTNASAAGIVITGTSARGVISGNVITGVVDGTKNNEGIYIATSGNNFTHSGNVITYFNDGMSIDGNNHVVVGNTFNNTNVGIVNGSGTGNFVFNNCFANTPVEYSGVSTTHRELYRTASITGTTIASGSKYTQTVSATGSQLGDFVDVGAPFDLQDMQATACVPLANQVQVTITNLTGVSKTIATGTWNFRFHN